MNNKLQKFKEDVTKSDTKVSELLRNAKILANELHDKEFLKWIENELSGYSKEPPEYRLVTGQPKAFNPYRGWMPAVFTNDERAQEALSERRLSQPVSELENLTNSDSDSLHIIYPPSVQKTLSKLFSAETQFALFLAPNQLVGILDAVRNKILDWLIAVGADQNSDLPIENKTVEIIFPEELIEKLPQDIKILADDFNFNFSNSRPKASMLILRRILPLSIVRKYQQKNKESEIKDINGDYLDTKALLGKIKSLLSQNRIYKEVTAYKNLTDGAQHSYTLNVYLADVRGAGIALRVFLDDIF